MARAGITDRAFEANLPKALAVVCREVEKERREIMPQVCPGIPYLLQNLKSQGKLLGVASGNLETVGWHKIEAASLRNFFSFGFFSDRCESRAGIFCKALEHVVAQIGRNARVCFIGDTPSDIRAAREIGASIVAVASGTFSLEDLSACSPDVCISDCGELLAAD